MHSLCLLSLRAMHNVLPATAQFVRAYFASVTDLRSSVCVCMCVCVNGRAARLRTTSTGGLSEDTVTLTDPSRHTQHSYEDPAGTSHDSIDTGIGSEGVQEMLTGLATKPPGQVRQDLLKYHTVRMFRHCPTRW